MEHSSQNTDINQPDKQESSFVVESRNNKNVSSTESETQFSCSLYVSCARRSIQDQNYDCCKLSQSHLEEAIVASEPLSAWRVSDTPCGLIAAFVRENDAEKLLQRANLARIFGRPVQVARFSARDSRYRQAVLLRDVPWAIPLQDINSALEKQGIVAANIERLRHFVRVEILDANHYEVLLRQGLDFFEAARFGAIPERCWHSVRTVRAAYSSGTLSRCSPLSDEHRSNHSTETSSQQATDGVLQCYRCQGFWHVAANCRHLPRCVRCGESHSVEFCSRPRNDPVCCHCSGPHHAGYRQCPVRLQLSNATPVSITLSATHTGSQYSASVVNSKTYSSCHSLRQSRS